LISSFLSSEWQSPLVYRRTGPVVEDTSLAGTLADPDFVGRSQAGRVDGATPLLRRFVGNPQRSERRTKTAQKF
jgi:hypothetical protein